MGAPPIRPCCGHPDGWHVDMCDGTEKCAGCDCCTPTGTVDNTHEHDLTPSEVALARMLGAWEGWPGRIAEGRDTGPTMVMIELHEVLYRHGLISPGALTKDGAALRDRARKAGVL